MKKVFEILTMVALLIWGSVFLYFFFSDRVNDYLSQSFRLFVPIAGVGMILLGVANLLNINRDAGVCSHDHAHGDHTDCEHDHHGHDHSGHDHHDHDHADCDHDEHEACDHHHHGDGHDHAGHDHIHEETTASSLAFALAVLLIPLLTSAHYSQDSFSLAYKQKWAQIEVDMQRMRQKKAAESRAAEAKAKAVADGENPYADPGGTGADSEASSEGEAWGKFTLEDLKKMVPQSSAGDFLLDVPQIFYTAGDQELMEVMEGISVETTAQVIEDTFEGSPANRLRAYRLLIECCAADARPISIPIDFAEAAPEYKEMGWYKLIGRLHFDEGEDHEYTPILQIKNFEPTPEPADWMAY